MSHCNYQGCTYLFRDFHVYNVLYETRYNQKVIFNRDAHDAHGVHGVHDVHDVRIRDG